MLQFTGCGLQKTGAGCARQTLEPTEIPDIDVNVYMFFLLAEDNNTQNHRQKL